MWDSDELRILRTLDAAVRSEPAMSLIDDILSRVERKLVQEPDDPMAWEPIPLRIYDIPLPETIRSSWVFLLRAGTTTEPERHPNSHQRMTSYGGTGDFQTKPADSWSSNILESDPLAPIEKRWVSIPPNVWHRGIVAGANWAVVSFHTVTDSELIEERAGDDGALHRRKYK